MFRSLPAATLAATRKGQGFTPRTKEPADEQYGLDPDGAEAHDESVVENYQQ